MPFIAQLGSILGFATKQDKPTRFRTRTTKQGQTWLIRTRLHITTKHFTWRHNGSHLDFMTVAHQNSTRLHTESRPHKSQHHSPSPRDTAHQDRPLHLVTRLHVIAAHCIPCQASASIQVISIPSIPQLAFGTLHTLAIRYSTSSSGHTSAGRFAARLHIGSPQFSPIHHRAYRHSASQRLTPRLFTAKHVNPRLHDTTKQIAPMHSGTLLGFNLKWATDSVEAGSF